MSRKHPISRAFADDPPPWPWVTARAAAKLLGVEPSFLSGLANNPIRACERPSKTGVGQPVLLFCKEDVLDLVSRVH